MPYPEETEPSPLEIAIANGDQEEIDIWVKIYHADINKAGVDGNTELMVQSRIGDKDRVKALLGEGKENVDAKNKDGYSALFLATCSGYPNVVKLLLRAGADFDIQDKDGYTPLMIAAKRDRPEIARLLLTKGADPTMQNHEGHTALSIAELYARTDIAHLLRAHASAN